VITAVPNGYSRHILNTRVSSDFILDFGNMPLLGTKIFQPAKPSVNVGKADKVYTIQHTKEQFQSKGYPFQYFAILFAVKNQHGGVDK
jgi:hypothetical protein